MPTTDYPTPEQIKKFWERCGLHYTVPYWLDSCNNLAFYGEEYYELVKSIDLNNLFLYAIPKIKSKYPNWKSVLSNWVDELTGDYEKDALSLFWICCDKLGLCGR